MELDLELLSIQNPWWARLKGLERTGQSLKFDPVIEMYNNHAVKWQPDILNSLDLNRDKIYSFFGARGVGKTTILKLLIKDLIDKKKTKPDSIFYYSCHNLDTFEQLNELIKIFLAWRKPKKEKRVFVFIDEITLIKDWIKGLNYLAKASRLKNVTLMATGSVAPDFKIIKAEEIAGQEEIITSLNFKDFLALINPDLFKAINKDNYLKYHDQLDYYFDIFLLTGGFISSINSFKEFGAVKQHIYSNFLYWFTTDIAKLGRDTMLARQILEQIILNLGQPVGYKTISKKTKAKTHLTIQEYLKIFELMFATKLVYQSDGREANKSKAKKIYFRDPFLFWLFYSYIHGSIDYWQFSRERLHRADIFSVLVDTVVFSHLIKNEQVKYWGERVTYLRDNIHKQEINFLDKQDKKICPILIRYNKKIISLDYKIFSANKFRQGIIITQNQLDLTKGVKIMPLTYWLMFY